MLFPKPAIWLVAIVLLVLAARHHWIWTIKPKPFRLHFGNETSQPSCTSVSCYRYYNHKTELYRIESLPDVDFELGEFYGGSLPVADDLDRTLYFFFKPAEERKVDELVIWLNGGPGCSSLYGFMMENGPVLWETWNGTDHTENPYAWSKTTNMLWIDQPVGAGFSEGELHPIDQHVGAQELVRFLKNWEALFNVENYTIYLTGESFAGRYIPYIANHMLDLDDKRFLNLQGALMYSPTIADGSIENRAPMYPFVIAHNDIYKFDSVARGDLNYVYLTCGYARSMETYLQFPPPGVQPQPNLTDTDSECYNITRTARRYAREENPCYNMYHINDPCPSKDHRDTWWLHQYFNREDVKKAIHAPLDREWHECNHMIPAKDGGTVAPVPIEGVLPRLIESTNRVLIASADLDGVILTNGTLLAIQNMTWNGKLGFQERPWKDFIVEDIDGVKGVLGKQYYERGLLWTETYDAGHMQPMYQPRAALRVLEWVLGRIDEL